MILKAIDHFHSAKKKSLSTSTQLFALDLDVNYVSGTVNVVPYKSVVYFKTKNFKSSRIQISQSLYFNAKEILKITYLH